MNFPRLSTDSISSSPESAFTLVELLSVVALMLVMLGLVVPSITGIRGSSDLTKTTYDVAALVDAARAQAMAKNSYVWIGFASNQDAATTVSERQLVVAIKSTADGTKPANLNTPNILQTLGKPEIFRNIQIADASQNNYNGQKPAADVQLASANVTDSFTTNAGGTSYTFRKILEINASGEVRIIGNTAFPRQIEIGLQTTHGNVADTSGNGSALQISGLTGQSRIFRP